jgi:enterochelin esterase family protein
MNRLLLPLFLTIGAALTTLAADAPKTKTAPVLTPKQILTALQQRPAGPAAEELAHRVTAAFGRQGLDQGKVKLEDTTVAWVVIAPAAARVLRNDGTEIGRMQPLGGRLQVLAREVENFQDLAWRIEAGGRTLGSGTTRIEHFPLGPDSQRQPGVPVGRLESFEWHSRIFSNTVRQVQVYIPAQYTAARPACVMVWQDGPRHADPNGPMRATVVMDNLIHKKEMPVTVGVFIDPGRRPNQKPGERPANRSFEYDSLGDTYARFLIEEMLPEVARRYSLRLRTDAAGRAIAGGSSGGICAFTVAWERPDQFHKVLSWVGSFVDLRGGHVYPYLIRKTERKPIRVYLLDGDNDLDNPFGNWPLANKMMAASLAYMKYDYRLDWNQCFHGSKGMAPSLPAALRWLWRDVK